MKDRSVRLTSSRLHLFAVFAAALVLASPLLTAEGHAAAQTSAVQTTAPGVTMPPVRTDSPRDTLDSFLRLRDSLKAVLLDYREERSTEGNRALNEFKWQFGSLIDLSEVGASQRGEVGGSTIRALLDILGRIELPDLDDVPDAEAFADGEPAQYRIPNTPIRIARIGAGPREGEFLFNARTVVVAPLFYKSIAHLPLRSGLDIDSWSTALPQVTGNLIPSAVVRAMPRSLRAFWLDTPIWKVIATVLLVLIAAFLLAGLHRLLSRTEPDTRIGAQTWRVIRPLAVMAVVVGLVWFLHNHLNTSGRFSAVVDTTSTILFYVAAAWLFWLVVQMFVEWLILSPRIPDEGLNANLLRLVARAVGIVGVIIIWAYGGQALGLPILSVLAGLGIGGLAVALAIRPTLENLIGGVILYVDKPVRVGDFCGFRGKTGTVETIGVRSTQLRALDRTLITVPNAQFADMEIVNWAQCDEMLINETIGVRYETTPDQLRYALAKLREMLHGHPRINSKTVRVRFSGYGESALNITIRVYAMTREFNDFHAIREDVLLRVHDIITEAGTGFAFPSTTLYLGKDSGLDEETGKKASARVEDWRRSGQLPFPRFSPAQLERIDDTLDYPPRGSPEAGDEDLDDMAGAERLSAEPLPDEDVAKKA